MLQTLNQYIDHTLLKPEAIFEEIKKLCQESIDYQFAAVCIQPTWVKEAHEFLKGSNVKLCSVVGFPLGANTTDTKAREASELSKGGVHEIDMVINIGALKSKDYKKVRQDIESVVKSADPRIVKVIIETCLLTDEEKEAACLLSMDAGAAFVKTSTGFSKSGATIHDVALMRKVVGPNFGVKASGGIRDLKTALAMIEAGASRLGTSAGVIIMESK
ncbi:deoxyribose-phosphate aldolase [Criblamydia sequanensis]|uniref:Deoxyribose-phosphate aldolase n=1 Tax=Candidatus Criblamydia sequanensis CRIB-18 TaxID=1437425 RepID=A0A090E2K0_9BACT|nr:deoxyribose-phosphate aldolase [Criblamydia sequanensis]CDR34874.1 Deoxyribose-phosphate aldolase [Criblamydia sequanensis CRIB-18]